MSDNYSEHYSDDSFWEKVAKYAKAAGKEVIEKALILYYVGNDPNTPLWAKAVITAALGYFILPLDAIPDVIPGAGYTDDIGALLVALAAVGVSVTDEHIAQAKAKLKQWFGE